MYNIKEVKNNKQIIVNVHLEYRYRHIYNMSSECYYIETTKAR